MKLKLCGIRRPEDVEMINEANPDYIGFVFAPTWRQISPETAYELGLSLKEGIKKVGIFVNEPIQNLLTAAKTAGLDVVQLHGQEDEAYISQVRKGFDGEIWKAVRVQSPADVKTAETLSADMLLYDSFVPGVLGGSGKRLDLNNILSAGPTRPFFLAGGINTENIDEILSEVTPYGLDISSAFETDRRKDKEKLNELMKILKGRLQ